MKLEESLLILIEIDLRSEYKSKRETIRRPPNLISTLISELLWLRFLSKDKRQLLYWAI